MSPHISQVLFHKITLMPRAIPYGITRLATPYSRGTVNGLAAFFPRKSSLQAEALLPARGVARSGFRPLSNILDCCHP